MNAAEIGALRETLTDFARWQGESDEDAAWAAEMYLRERGTPPLLIAYPDGHTHPSFIGCSEATPTCPLSIPPAARLVVTHRDDCPIVEAATKCGCMAEQLSLPPVDQGGQNGV